MNISFELLPLLFIKQRHGVYLVDGVTEDIPVRYHHVNVTVQFEDNSLRRVVFLLYSIKPVLQNFEGGWVS